MKRRILVVSAITLVLFSTTLGVVPESYATSSGTGTLTVNKDIDNQARQSVSIDDFVIVVEDEQGNEIRRQTADEGGNEFTVPAGDYSVDEIGPSGVRFESQESFGCSGTMTAGGQVTCSITNVIKSDFMSEGDVVGGSAGANAQDGTEDEGNRFVTSESDVTVENSKNPPFQRCESKTVDIANQGGAQHFVVPSSAEYVIEGTASIKKLNNLMQGTDRVNIEILHDLEPNDGITLGYSDPIYTGRIVPVDSDGTVSPFEVDGVDFQVNKINTNCNYITLVKPLDFPSTNKDFTPLGNIGVDNLKETKSNTRQPSPNTNDLLIGGEILTRSPEELIKSVVLNPPFATCVVKAPADDADSVALVQYNINGKVDLSKLRSIGDMDNNQVLSIRLTSDIILQNDDLAKVANTNNPYVNTKWVIDPDTPDTEIVDYDTLELSTDCTGVGFDNMPQVN